MSPGVSRDEVEGNIRTRGKTKLTCFPRDHILSAFYIFRLPLKKTWRKYAVVVGARLTTTQSYPSRDKINSQDTIEFHQGHVSESLGI